MPDKQLNGSDMNQIEEPMQAVPKGSMCLSCVRRRMDCSHLNFEEMPRLGVDKIYNVMVVACTEYKRHDETGD